MIGGMKGWGPLPGLGGLAGLGMLSKRDLKQLCAEVGVSFEGLFPKQEPDGSEVAERAERKGTVNREEVAAFLRVDVKTIYRMDKSGELKRCPGFHRGVRYFARDVLKLASAR